MSSEVSAGFYHLEWTPSEEWTQCDGCGREGFSAEEKILTGIESCCGSGCTRCLCLDCVKRAAHERESSVDPGSLDAGQISTLRLITANAARKAERAMIRDRFLNGFSSLVQSHPKWRGHATLAKTVRDLINRVSRLMVNG